MGYGFDGAEVGNDCSGVGIGQEAVERCWHRRPDHGAVRPDTIADRPDDLLIGPGSGSCFLVLGNVRGVSFKWFDIDYEPAGKLSRHVWFAVRTEWRMAIAARGNRIDQIFPRSTAVSAAVAEATAHPIAKAAKATNGFSIGVFPFKVNRLPGNRDKRQMILLPQYRSKGIQRGFRAAMRARGPRSAQPSLPSGDQMPIIPKQRWQCPSEALAKGANA